MKKINILLALVIILLVLVGCNATELEEAITEIDILQKQLIDAGIDVDYLQGELDNLSTEKENVDTAMLLLSIDYQKQSNELEHLNRSVSFLPSYIRQFIGEVDYMTMGAIIPPNSYLLLDKGKLISEYTVLELEQGPCEVTMLWVLYEADNYVYSYATNIGCNPEWFITQPLLIVIEGNIYSFSDAMEKGYITISDLEESSYISKTDVTDYYT